MAVLVLCKYRMQIVTSFCQKTNINVQGREICFSLKGGDAVDGESLV
jgi:hypothetical protein